MATIMDDLGNLHLGGFETPEALTGADDTSSLDDGKKRRPPNAFLLYCIENRGKVREEHPDKPNIEVTRLLGDMWKMLSDEERLPFKIRAKEQQDVFKRLNPNYKYAKAKERRNQKKNGLDGFDPKHHIELPDIVTLVNLPPEQLRECVQILESQFLMTCEQSFQYLPNDAEPTFQHAIDENFTHDVFQAGQ